MCLWPGGLSSTGFLWEGSISLLLDNTTKAVSENVGASACGVLFYLELWVPVEPRAFLFEEELSKPVVYAIYA